MLTTVALGAAFTSHAELAPSTQIGVAMAAIVAVGLALGEAKGQAKGPSQQAKEGGEDAPAPEKPERSSEQENAEQSVEPSAAQRQRRRAAAVCFATAFMLMLYDIGRSGTSAGLLPPTMRVHGAVSNSHATHAPPRNGLPGRAHGRAAKAARHVRLNVTEHQSPRQPRNVTKRMEDVARYAARRSAARRGSAA